MDNKLLFFFAAIGVFNALVISVFYLVFKKRSYGTFFFGALVLLLSVRAGVSCFHFFDKEISGWIIQLGLNANVLTGLVLWFLIRGSRNTNEQMRLIRVPAVSHRRFVARGAKVGRRRDD